MNLRVLIHFFLILYLGNLANASLSINEEGKIFSNTLRADNDQQLETPFIIKLDINVPSSNPLIAISFGNTLKLSKYETEIRIEASSDVYLNRYNNNLVLEAEVNANSQFSVDLKIFFKSFMSLKLDIVVLGKSSNYIINLEENNIYQGIYLTERLPSLSFSIKKAILTTTNFCNFEAYLPENYIEEISYDKFDNKELIKVTVPWKNMFNKLEIRPESIPLYKSNSFFNLKGSYKITTESVYVAVKCFDDETFASPLRLGQVTHIPNIFPNSNLNFYIKLNLENSTLNKSPIEYFLNIKNRPYDYEAFGVLTSSDNLKNVFPVSKDSKNLITLDREFDELYVVSDPNDRLNDIFAVTIVIHDTSYLTIEDLLMTLIASQREYIEKSCPSYECNNLSANCLLAQGNLKQNRTIKLSSCGDNKYCFFRYEDLASNIPIEGECLKNERNLSYPGEYCEKDEDCSINTNTEEAIRPFKCDVDKKICTGYAENQKCKHNENCISGLYCDRSLEEYTCKKQKDLNQECKKTLDCKNNLICYDNKCINIFSLPLGTNISYLGDFEQLSACESGYFLKHPKEEQIMCAEIRYSNDASMSRSENSLVVNCSIGSTCKYDVVFDKEGKDAVSIDMDCKCGYEANRKGYCPFSRNDTSTKAYFDKFIEIIKKNLNNTRHTSKRYYPRKDFDKDIINDDCYLYYLDPGFLFADKCVKEGLNFGDCPSITIDNNNHQVKINKDNSMDSLLPSSNLEKSSLVEESKDHKVLIILICLVGVLFVLALIAYIIKYFVNRRRKESDINTQSLLNNNNVSINI